MWRTLILAIAVTVCCSLTLPGLLQADQPTGGSAQPTDGRTSPGMAGPVQVIPRTAASTADSGSAPAVPAHRLPEGRRERRILRTAQWVAGLRGDMRRIYDTYGGPSTRYREMVMGRVIERWTYLGRGKQFAFQDGNLVKTIEFPPGSPWIDEAHRNSLILSP
jgi:hypothetical protein